MENKNNLLIVAGCLSIFASLLHIGCIFGGADWYRFFGAGEEMVQLAAAGDTYPTLVTLAIATILAFWGFYAFSGAGLLFRLPFLKTCLVLISTVYLLRGVAGFLVPFFISAPFVQQNSITFWLTSSAICFIFGIFYLLGTITSWR